MPCVLRLLALLALLVPALGHPPTLRAQDPERREVWIAVTAQLRGSITSRVLTTQGAPRGIAHVAPILRELRTAHPDLILVDAGGALSGAADAPSVPRGSPPPIAAAMRRLGYDAAALGERDLSLDRATVVAVLAGATFPWLGANVTSTADTLRLAPYRIVERSGLRVALIGVAAPGALLGIPPGPGRWMVSDAKEAVSAQARLLREREEADLIVVLGGGGTGGESERETSWLLGMPPSQAAGRIADEVPDVDLVIASRGRAPRKGETARPNLSYRIPMIEPAPGARGLTLLRLDLARDANRWRIAGVSQETRWAKDQLDPAILAPVRGELEAMRAHFGERTATYLAGRASKRARDACAGAVVHAAALRQGTLGPEAAAVRVSLLPFQWYWPRYVRGDAGKPVTRGDVQQWIPNDDPLVAATLTGRQISLLLEPYVRYSQGWRVPPAAVLFPGGLETTVERKRSEAAAIGLEGKSEPLKNRASYTVWMTEYHRFGGGGLTPRALVEPSQAVRLTATGVREAVVEYLADARAMLPSACEHVLAREPPAAKRTRRSARG